MSRRRYTVAEDVAWLSAEPGPTPLTYLARLPDGPVVVLGHPAGLVWSAALDSADTVVEVVAATVEDPPDSLGADVRGFLDRLVEQGWLVLDEGPAGG